jgi:transcriptional regulator GlxA family with amidase domain
MRAGAYRADTSSRDGDVMRISGWFVSTLLLAVSMTQAASPPDHELRVAFVISDGFNVIDFAGPWEVFQDAMLHTKTANGTQMRSLYELYTVSSATGTVKMAGAAAVKPEFTLKSAPQPDIVVIGAQSDNSPELLDWLRAQAARGATIMSVCTGAKKLALSGLIDGKSATSHHDYIEGFRKDYPKVNWQTSKRFVRASDNIYTAGGLTSGIDLALHIVAKQAGAEVARSTADYMEYHGDGWSQAD